MKTHFILLAVLLLVRNLLPAQNLPAYSIDSLRSTTFSWPCTGTSGWLPISGCPGKEKLIRTEYPPYIIGGSWRTYLFTDGKGSSIASHPNSMLSAGELNFKNNGSAPALISSPTGCA